MAAADGNQQALMLKSSAESAPGVIPLRGRNSEPMPPLALPISEVLVVADCWRAEPDAEAAIHRAVAAAAGMVDADVGDAELAVMMATYAPRKASERLIELARERAEGGGDNCSLAIVRLQPTDSVEAAESEIPIHLPERVPRF